MSHLRPSHRRTGIEHSGSTETYELTAAVAVAVVAVLTVWALLPQVVAVLLGVAVGFVALFATPALVVTAVVGLITP